MDVLGIVAETMERAERRLERTAARLSSGPSDEISLSDQAVEMMKARQEAQTATAMARTAEEINRSTIDLLG